MKAFNRYYLQTACRKGIAFSSRLQSALQWNDVTMTKRCIIRCGKRLVADDSELNYQFLAFHTEEQRELFIEENEQLVTDYLMLD